MAEELTTRLVAQRNALRLLRSVDPGYTAVEDAKVAVAAAQVWATLALTLPQPEEVPERPCGSLAVHAPHAYLWRTAARSCVGVQRVVRP